MKSNTRTAGSIFLMATLLLSPLAEAKRIGGGSSHGMSRSSSTYGNSNTGSSSGPQPSPSQATPQRSGPGWGGVAAGVAGGALLGSMMGHSNNANANTAASQPVQTENGSGAWNQTPPAEKKSGFPWFLLILLAGVGYFVYRRFTAKKTALAGNASSSTSPFGYGNSNAAPQPGPSTGGNTNIFGQPVGGSSSSPSFGAPAPFTNNGQSLPDGTSYAVFLRQARATFLHMQTMNSSSNLEELRRYFTPEMFNAVHSDIANNHDTAEFPQLNAQIVGNSQENGQYVVSVLYSGTVSEDVNSGAIPFSETWHFVQLIGSQDQKWLVAGIQQG